MPRPHDLRLERRARILSMLTAAQDGLDWNALVKAQVFEFQVSKQTAVALLNDLTIAGLASSRYGVVRITEKGRRSVIG